MNVRDLTKQMILLLFLRFFAKELEDVEPEVDKFIAGLIEPYIKTKG